MSADSDFEDRAPWEREKTEMDTILAELGFGSIVCEKFDEQKVFPSTVALLTDQELGNLGVVKVGDRALLRKHCRDSQQSKKVASEVRRVMGPRTPHSGYNAIGGMTLPQIPRRPKRSSGHGLAAPAKKGRSSSATFQKKLVVFRFMPDSSVSFTRCDRYILVRGLLPAVSVDASEIEVRSEILKIIKSAQELQVENIHSSDFEFINMSGKQASVPKCKEGFTWNGRAVKELAGSGSIYVRLTKDVKYISEASIGNSSSDSEDLPDVVFSRPCGRSSSGQSSTSDNDNTSVRQSSLSSSFGGLSSSTCGGQDLTCSTASFSGQSSSSFSGQSRPSSSGQSSSACNASRCAGPSMSQSPEPIVIEDSDESIFDNSTTDFDKLSELISSDKLKYVYETSRSSFQCSMDCLLEGPSFGSLRSLLFQHQIVSSDDSPRIKVHAGDDHDDWVEAAMVFYKQAKFDKRASMRVSIRGQPAVDTGGVRRQFFSVVFAKLASSAMGVFEGPPCRLRPMYKASLLSSGLLKTIGTMIAHSFLLDGRGFPLIADYCYYYIAGCYDLAITSIVREDIGLRVKRIIEEVDFLDSDSEMSSYERFADLLELMQESGCDVPICVKNKKAIIQCLILHDALHKRRVYLDALASGLEVMGVKSLACQFPETLKPAFVYVENVSADGVVGMLRPDPRVVMMNADQLRVWEFLMDFIKEAGEAELKAFVQYNTGSSAIVGTIVITICEAEEAISAGTCGQQLILSSSIKDKDLFFLALKAVIFDTSFTML